MQILTLLAIPKSASFTTPFASTSKFAPLISLQLIQKRYTKNRDQGHA